MNIKAMKKALETSANKESLAVEFYNDVCYSICREYATIEKKNNKWVDDANSNIVDIINYTCHEIIYYLSFCYSNDSYANGMTSNEIAKEKRCCINFLKCFLSDTKITSLNECCLWDCVEEKMYNSKDFTEIKAILENNKNKMAITTEKNNTVSINSVDKNINIAVENGKETNTMKKTVKTLKAMDVEKKTTVNNSKKEVAVITEENFKNSVVKGGKSKDVRSELKNYLTSQFNALYLTSKIDTFQLKVSDVIKEFLVISDNKINASSYDLNAMIQEICYELAVDYKNNGEKRIPCIKANSNNVAILMTCKVEKFEFFYEKNVKSEKAIEKAKKAREEKKIKEEEEKAREEEEKKNSIVNGDVIIDDGEKATTCIMLLLAKYGDKIDLVAVKNALETIEKATSKKSEKKNKKIA